YEDEAFCCSFSSYCIRTIFHCTAFRAMEHHLLQKNSRQHRRIIRKQERKNRTGLSDSHTWRPEQVGLHPARVQISPMAIGWFEDRAIWSTPIWIVKRRSSSPPPICRGRARRSGENQSRARIGAGIRTGTSTACPSPRFRRQ